MKNGYKKLTLFIVILLQTTTNNAVFGLLSENATDFCKRIFFGDSETILDAQISKAKIAFIHNNNFTTKLSKISNKQEKTKQARLIITKQWKQLNNSEFQELLNFIDNKQDKALLTELYIKRFTKKLNREHFYNLLKQVPNEHNKDNLELYYLENNIGQLDIEDIDKILQKHTLQHTKVDSIISSFLRTKFKQFDKPESLFNDIKDEAVRLCAKQQFERFINKNKIEFVSLLKKIKDQKIKKRLFEECYLIPEDDSFSTCHLRDNLNNEDLPCHLLSSKPEIRELALEMMEYQHEQEQKGNVVYFHGQSWYWKQYADLYKKLYQVDYAVQDDYTFFRFNDSYTITSEEERSLAQNGADAARNYHPNLLFTNRSLFANYRGANTVCYVQDNFDQTRFRKKEIEPFDSLFKELGYHKELQFLQKNKSRDLQVLLDAYRMFHQKASEFGNFLVITMPKETAKKISYCSHPYGIRRGEYNALENKDTIPFDHEYCIALGPTMLNPERAREAGITIKEFNAADPEKLAARDKALQQIVDLLVQTRKALEEKK